MSGSAGDGRAAQRLRPRRASGFTRSGPPDPGGARRARPLSVHARSPPERLPRAALDDAPVRRLRHRRGVEPALPLPAGAGHDRPVRRLRPADADRLRLRRPARARRGRPRRRRDLQPRGHGAAVRRDPARARLHLDDDQRHGGDPARALHRRRAPPRPRGGRALGHRAERHPEGVRRARHLDLPAGSPRCGSSAT